MSKKETKQHLIKARTYIGKAMLEIRAAKQDLDNGAHKHLCEAIVSLGDSYNSLSPSDPHLNLE